MRHSSRNARIVAQFVLMVSFLLLPAEVAEAQVQTHLPTAPYQVIDLYPMSAGSTTLAPFNEGPGGFGHYLQLAAGGQFIANQWSFFPHLGSTYLWNGSSSPVSLNPTGTGFTSAFVSGTDGVQQIGAATSSSYNSASHATLWSGTAAAAVDLNPSQLGATASFGFGVKNGQQVGYSIINGSTIEVATLWNGSASSAMLLTSPTYSYYTEAIATDGVHQVGWVGVGPALDGGAEQAVMWTGTAASMVNLHPAGYGTSEALTVAGGQEGGYATTKNLNQFQVHPGIWTGSASSFVDLTPPAFATAPNLSGIVMSTNGVQQVGYFGINGNVLAPSPGSPMIWSGTADSAELLPTFGNDYFTPFDIDDAGNIYGIAYDPTTGAATAVEWVPTPTPEPGSMALLGCGAVGLLLRRRKRA